MGGYVVIAAWRGVVWYWLVAALVAWVVPAAVEVVEVVEEVKAVAVMAVTDQPNPNPTQPTFSSADKFILAMPGESGDRGGAPSGSGGGDGGSSAARDAIAARCLLELAVRVQAQCCGTAGRASACSSQTRVTSSVGLLSFELLGAMHERRRH